MVCNKLSGTQNNEQYCHYSLVAYCCSYTLCPLVGALYLSMCYLRPIS